MKILLFLAIGGMTGCAGTPCAKFGNSLAHGATALRIGWDDTVGSVVIGTATFSTTGTATFKFIDFTNRSTETK